ncbi:MAG: hypothetical protein M3R24_11315 [Chloroflexota bacterium]|nr:hypothetical protein [Chloroflexota bacterium]
MFMYPERLALLSLQQLLEVVQRVLDLPLVAPFDIGSIRNMREESARHFVIKLQHHAATTVCSTDHLLHCQRAAVSSGGRVRDLAGPLQLDHQPLGIECTATNSYRLTEGATRVNGGF